MQFKIKVNYRDGRAPSWWMDTGSGCTTQEAEASAYTVDAIQDIARDYWFKHDRDAGCDCWLSLKLVP